MNKMNKSQFAKWWFQNPPWRMNEADFYFLLRISTPGLGWSYAVRAAADDLVDKYTGKEEYL